MSDEPRNLTPGPWWVDAPCPRCGEVEVLPVSIGVVLTTPGDDTPTLRLAAKGGQGTARVRADPHPHARRGVDVRGRPRVTARGPLMYGDHYRALVLDVTTTCALCPRLLRRGSRAWEHVRSTTARVVCGRCIEDAASAERRALAAAAPVEVPGQLGIEL